MFFSFNSGNILFHPFIKTRISTFLKYLNAFLVGNFSIRFLLKLLPLAPLRFIYKQKMNVKYERKKECNPCHKLQIYS